MPEIHLLEELLIVLAVTISIAYLVQKMRVPATVGFLLARVVIGPGGLGLTKSVSVSCRRRRDQRSCEVL
ncbi:MAG: hypothetical protein ACREQ2_28780 [Candidatus Binatia bacterium]